MKVLYVVRHGETVYNLTGQKMGHLDSALTLKGIRGVEGLASSLRREALPPEAIFSSDLPRAYNTANIFREILGMDLEHLHLSQFLREVNLGDYGGYESQEIRNVDPGYKKDMDLIFPNGESLSFMKTRVNYFVSNGILRSHETSVLLVTHAGPIRALLAEHTNKSLRDLYQKSVSRHIYRFEFDNRSVVAIDEFNGTRWRQWKL